MIKFFDYLSGLARLGKITGEAADAKKFLRGDGTYQHLGAQGDLFYITVEGDGGTPSPDVTGNYYFDGDYNGKARYVSEDDPLRSVIYRSDGSGDVYQITDELSYGWSQTGAAEKIDGSYSPSSGSATGNLTVTLVSKPAQDAADAQVAKTAAETAQAGAETAEENTENLLFPHVLPRAIADSLHFDGATSGARAYWPIGAAGAIGTDDFTLEIQMANEEVKAGTQGLIGLSDVSDEVHGGTGSGGVRISLFTAGTNLWARIYTAGSSVDYNYWILNDWTTSAGKQPVLHLVREAGVITIYSNGKALTPDTLSSTGSAPGWDASISSDYLVAGVRQAIDLLKDTLRPPRFYNRALTQAEIANNIQRGPSFANLAGGSQESKSASALTHISGITGFTSDAMSWSGDAAGDGTNNPRVRSDFFSVKAGQKVRVRFDINVAVASSASFYVSLTDGVSATSSCLSKNAIANLGTVFNLNGYTNGGVGLTDSGSYEITFTAAETTTAARLLWDGSSGWVQAGISVTGVEVIVQGLIINPEVTRSAQIRDTGPNRIHGVLTAGVTPLGGRMRPITGIQSATGYVQGDNPLIFDPHHIAEVWVKPTTATVPDLTLRRTGPAGTEVVSSVSAGTEGEWKQLAVLPASREGAAGDKYHFTFSPSAEIEYEIFPRER